MTEEEKNTYKNLFEYPTKIIANLEIEKQQLISFLEDRIKNLSQMTAQFISIGDKVTSIPEIQIETFQEVLDFVKKGGKE